MPRLKTDAPKKPKRRGPSAAPEESEQFRIIKQGALSWVVLIDQEVIEEFTDEQAAKEYVEWFQRKLQAAYSLGQTFCTAHTQVYKRVQVLEERLVLAAEREQMLRQALRIMLDSATPNAKEHPTMNAAWRTARAALTEDSNGR